MSNKSFSLKFKGDARNTGSMRNDIDVSFESMNEKFKLATDEGAFHGGKEQPHLHLPFSPLHYVAA